MKIRSARGHAGVLAMGISVGVAIACLWALSGRASGPRTFSVPALHPSVRAENIIPAHTAAPKPIYPYSVIPGGVRSRQELADAIARDSVVAEHYRSVSLGSVRVETLAEDRLAYVSYRIGNKIYWTKNKVRLKKGETILSDGLTQVRGRCGNCISMQPMGPTLDNEPETVQTDALIAPGTAVQSAAPPESSGIGPGTILSTGLLAGPEESSGQGPFATMRLGPSSGGAAIATSSGSSGTPGSGTSLPESLPIVPADIPTVAIPPITLPPEGGPNGGGTPPPFTPPTDPLPPLIVPDVPPVIVHQPPPTGSVPVPEPGTLLLIGSGLATMLARRRNS